MVSLVIPTKGRSSLRLLIESIFRSANTHGLVERRDFEVVVAWDRTKETTIPDFGTSVQIVSSPWPGVNRARNVGGDRASGDILWFLDDDVELNGGNFHAVLDEVFSSIDCIAAGGNYRSFEDARWIERGYNAFCSLWRISAGTPNSEQLLGGTLAVRKSEWRRVGGFDEDIEYGGAETAFVQRLKAIEGRRIVFDERLDVYHRSGDRSLESWRTLASRQALRKKTTRVGLPQTAVRSRRALQYLAELDPKTGAALIFFSLPYLMISKTAFLFVRSSTPSEASRTKFDGADGKK